MWQALASAGMQLLQNEQQKDMFQQANEFNLQQGIANREFQKEMSNTAYQRTVADMIKAGLNPMLAYSQGGASTPSGSSASSVAPPKMEPISNAAMSTLATVAQVDNLKADTAKKHAEEENTKAQTATELGRPANLAADTDRIRKQAELYVRQHGLTSAQTDHVATDIRRVLATERNLDAQTALTRINEVLQKYDIPRMKAESDYFKTDVGRTSPHNKYGPQTPFRFLEGIGERGYNSAKQFFGDSK